MTDDSWIVDGIKTGFTRASGFNLATSVHRDGRYIVAVVMGGRSSLERDAQMRELISAQIKGIALKRSVPVIAKSNQPNETKPALAYVPVASQGNPLDPIQPLSSTVPSRRRRCSRRRSHRHRNRNRMIWWRLAGYHRCRLTMRR